MKKRNKIITLLMAAALTGSSLLGCGGTDNKGSDQNPPASDNGKTEQDAPKDESQDVKQGKTEITFWTQDSTTYMGWFKEAVEQFNAQSETVQVNAEYFPNFSDKLSQAFAADQQPDVAFTWQGITPWAKAGKLAPVSEECLTKDEMETQFYEGALKNKLYDGQYYCVPAEINVESPSLFVNMDLLDKMGKELPASWIENNGPATWEELEQFAKELTIKDGDSITQSGLAYVYSSWEAMFPSLIWQYGGDYRDEENKVVHFDTEEARKAAEFMLKYCKGPDAISDSGTSRYDLFTQGTAAMCVGAPWYASSFDTDAEGLNYQVFNMPAFVDGADPYHVATGGWGYIVSSQTDESVQKAAWEFVKYMTTTEMTESWALGTGALSADKNAFANLEYDPNVGSVEKCIAITTEVLQYGQEDGAYTLDASQLLYTICRQQLRQMLEDGDIDTALKTMEAEGNAMIDANLNR